MEHRVHAANASKQSTFVKFVVGPGEGSVGRFVARDVELIGRQHAFPLGFGADHPFHSLHSLWMSRIIERHDGDVFSRRRSRTLTRSDRNQPGERERRNDKGSAAGKSFLPVHASILAPAAVSPL